MQVSAGGVECPGSSAIPLPITHGMGAPSIDAAHLTREAAHVPSLDGLRAIAILSVMGVHAGVPRFDLGWIGVDIFFVLSGFLITTLLVREGERTGSISLTRFWARRALRLMPAYWLYIGVLCILMAAGVGHLQSHGGWSPAVYIASLWGYFVNYAPMGGIWGPGNQQFLTLTLWSLAVEEQFYLLWPGLCWLILRQRHRVHPAIVAWGLVLAFMVYRQCAADARLNHELFTRGVGIIIGCAAALTLMRGPSPAVLRWIKAPWIRGGVPALIIVLILAFTAPYVTGRLHTDSQKEAYYTAIQRYAVPLLDLLFAVLTVMLWYGPRDRLDRALACRPLAYLGRISYGLYLYQMAVHLLVWGPLLGGIEQWPKWPKFALRLFTFFGLTTLVASLSRVFIEQPFLRMKKKLR